MNASVRRLLSLFLILCLLLAGCSQKPTDAAVTDQWVGENKPSDFTEDTEKEQTPSQNQGTSQKEETDKNQNAPSKEQTNGTSDKTEEGSGSLRPSWDQIYDPNEPVSGGDPAFWVSPCGKGVSKTRPFSAIKLQYILEDDRYYFFCPAGIDPDALQIWMEGVSSCKIANKTYANGDTISLKGVDQKKSVSFSFEEESGKLSVMRSANIGSLHMTTDSGSLAYIHAEKGNEEAGMMSLLNAAGESIYNGKLNEIKGRGNSTWERPKKSYQIKLDTKTDLVGQGAGAAKTWVLLANYGDRSLIRNHLALELAYQVGMKDAPRSTFVDLYCNGEYLGTYQLCEKVQVAESRLEYNNLEKTTEKVNSQPLKTYPTFGSMKNTKAGSKKGFLIPNNPTDITGSYLLEIEMADRYKDEKSGFVTERGKCVVIKEPERASKEQVEYIANYFQEFEDAVFSENGINPKTGKAFYEYFDLTSLAQKYVLEELVKNFDADKTSQYYYKPSDSESKVGFCGPAWDYDNAMDNFKPAARNEGLYAAYNHKYVYYNASKHKIFNDEVSRVWNNYLAAIETVTEEKKSSKFYTLEQYYELLSPSAAMNFTVWRIIDTPIFINTYVDTGSTYREHIDYLNVYLTKRSIYLSSEWKK